MIKGQTLELLVVFPFIVVCARIIRDIDDIIHCYGTVCDVVLLERVCKIIHIWQKAFFKHSLERKRQYGIDQIGNDPEGT